MSLTKQDLNSIKAIVDSSVTTAFDKLALQVAAGFEEVSNKFEAIGHKFDEVEDRLDHLNTAVADLKTDIQKPNHQ